MGLICACLPSLNIVISKVRNHSYKSNNGYYEGQSSSVPLSRVKGGGGSKAGVSLNQSRREPEPHEINSDESHLISYAGAVDRSQTDFTHGGIHKTIDVQQTFEVVEGDGRGRGSGSGSPSSENEYSKGSKGRGY